MPSERSALERVAALYPIGPQSIREAHLQKELRALHTLVETVCRMVATRDML